ncbi:sensor histidine kinase [Pseudokineococcus lusitanus]|uniref:histidine kinase n=1 Tax=Pseudokineococcus lusitanus TaxID=763993 RepID=A0A3N1HTM6_9ACTN|nr:histidine kinase [Pseudokineococcus lusitanus]ROP45770.1 signal transduction histidine kinase [Pseudokineococcus lusitanus]
MTSPTAPLPARDGAAPPAPAAPAGATPAARPGADRRRRPATVLLALAHLGALGTLGAGVGGVLVALLGTALGLVPVLGLGLVLLVGLVYVLFGVAWLETARVDGLYRLGLPPLQLRRRTGPGFSGALRTVGRQTVDGAMWRALASAAVATLLGLLLLALAGAAASSLALLAAPLYARGSTVDVLWTEVGLGTAPVVGLVGLVLSLGGALGLALLHGVVAPALLLPSREAQLEARASAADARSAGAVHAADVERTRIERDLHDGVQPRLVSVGMTLGMARAKIDDDPAAARALVEEAHVSTKAAITELRQLARGIHASVLEDRGLDAALSAVAARSHVPVDLDVRVDGRCSRTAEAAVYFAVAESLTNAAKHSRARACRVVVRRRPDGVLWARVEDDGVGGARVLPGGGLDGVTSRAAAAGGSVRLDSPAGGPTALEVVVPCAS